MLTIQIPVDWDGQDTIVKWFTHVHNGSRIDFQLKRDGGLVLINEENGLLYTYVQYTPEELFEQLEPKTSVSENSRWHALVSERCSSQFGSLESKLPNHQFTDREVLDLYLKTEYYDLSKEPAWYVGDIRWEYEDPQYLLDSEPGQAPGMKSVYCVSIEICAEYQMLARRDKIRLEEKLAELYFDLKAYNHPEIPNRFLPHIMPGFGREAFVAKMMFALKGRVEFREVEYLDYLTEQIKREKYPDIDNTWLMHPNELGKDAVIDNPVYRFPREITWADVISAMGTFSTNEDDSERTIQICQECIEGTVRLLAETKAFRTDIVDAASAIVSKAETDLYEDLLWQKRTGDIYALPASEVTYEDKLAVTSSILRWLVITHELGHMVFRKGNEYRLTSQRESLANWFACLMSEPLERELLKALLPYQGPAYQDFVHIPSGYQLTETEYYDYCNKIIQLLVEW